MATSKNRRKNLKYLYSDDLKKDNNRCSFSKTMNKFVKQKNILLIFILGLNISLVRSQKSQWSYEKWLRERDPRFYSREGVDYRPPDPGDPNYR